jgi:protein-L-isoaspartate(D-aspartate) O-methyltransferase
MEHDKADPAQAHSIQDEQLQKYRTVYSQRVMTAAGINSVGGLGGEIAAALATIPREKYVEPAPWAITSRENYLQTVSYDQATLYQDVVVPLGAGLGLNNGQPSLHARCLAALAPRKGEHIVHVGAGTGYYTTMLVSETGRVDALAFGMEMDAKNDPGGVTECILAGAEV